MGLIKTKKSDVVTGLALMQSNWWENSYVSYKKQILFGNLDYPKCFITKVVRNIRTATTGFNRIEIHQSWWSCSCFGQLPRLPAPNFDGGGPGAQAWWEAPCADIKCLGRGWSIKSLVFPRIINIY